MKKVRLSIKMKFNLHVMLGFAAAILVSCILMGILHMFNADAYIPNFVIGLLLSLALGTVVNAYFGKRFFDPIMRLSRAMQQVADGDFDVRLDEAKEWGEIQEIYRNFNIMAEELEATEILQTDFVTNVSHEFKTPINAIEGYATLLQGSEDEKVYVEKILFNTKRLSKLVGNILLLSKVDNQVIQSRQTLFRMDEQIRQSIVMLESEWSKKNINLDVELANVEFVGNESLMHHIWDNLIGNAIKFSPVGGMIRMRLLKQNEEILFMIEDDGPGITEEDKKHIYDRFYQSDSSHKQEGNGLGLALVKKILNSCNGEIQVENRSVGGCRFTVKFSIIVEK